VDRRWLMVPLALVLLVWPGVRERQRTAPVSEPPRPTPAPAAVAAQPALPCAVLNPTEGQTVPMYGSEVNLQGNAGDRERVYLVVTDCLGGRWLWSTYRREETCTVRPQIGQVQDSGQRFALQAAVGPAGLPLGEVPDEAVFTSVSEPVEVVRD